MSMTTSRLDNLVPSERVAVIAIHGVADQKSGDTARAISALLVNAGSAAQARYSEGICDGVILAVPPLPPMEPSRPPADDGMRDVLVDNGNGSRTMTRVQGPRMRPVEKALRQSLRSDFQRPRWITAHTGPDTPQEEVEELLRQYGSPPPPNPVAADLGIGFSDYLLFKAERDGTENEAYEATRIRMMRSEDGGRRIQQVDVYEMYWADLSRLSGTLPRIVTELFTMVFRLSRLGRDTVDQAGRVARESLSPDTTEAKRWARLSGVQIALDWALSALLANLVLQLLLVGLLITVLGLAQLHPKPVGMVVAWTLPALGVWWISYRYSSGRAGWLMAMVVASAAVWLLHQLPAHWVIGLASMGLLGLLCDYGLRVADARFPATRATGLAFMVATALVLLGHVTIKAFSTGPSLGLHLWVQAAMRAAECLLLLAVCWWATVPALLTAWLILGHLAARGDAKAKASVATGRFGLFLSIASFLVLTMALWALLSKPIELGATSTPYDPLIFTSVKPGKDAPVCDSAPMCGSTFVKHGFETSTESFSLVAGLTLLLAIYLVVVFVPSVLAEVKDSVGTSQTLGRWLSAGFRRLDDFITLLVIAGVVIACGMGALMLLARFEVAPGGWVGDLSQRAAELSKYVLTPFVLGAATVGAALTALGGVLSRYAPWLRSPLDVALDVDNYFREFPRSAIPRARIFSRYVALLEHVVAQGCDRVVIVAHSQGSAISAELLRYLQHRAKQTTRDGSHDRVTHLWSDLEGRVDLFTAGCPLRQLYAARFPDLYAWVTQATQGRSGPLASDVGVRRWINAYTTGDYVGRWLWCDAPPASETVSGRATLWDPATTPVAWGAELDVCLGIGAHTHYFEQKQKVVASLIEDLVAGRQSDSNQVSTVG